MKPYTITKRSEFPKCIRKYKELKGMCIGGCVGGSKWNKNSEAHAHTGPTDKFYGYICVHHWCLTEMKYLMFHEIAHILADNIRVEIQPHGKLFKETLINIGGRIDDDWWWD